MAAILLENFKHMVPPAKARLNNIPAFTALNVGGASHGALYDSITTTAESLIREDVIVDGSIGIRNGNFNLYKFKMKHMDSTLAIRYNLSGYGGTNQSFFFKHDGDGVIRAIQHQHGNTAEYINPYSDRTFYLDPVAKHIYAKRHDNGGIDYSTGRMSDALIDLLKEEIIIGFYSNNDMTIGIELREITRDGSVLPIVKSQIKERTITVTDTLTNEDGSFNPEGQVNVTIKGNPNVYSHKDKLYLSDLTLQFGKQLVLVQGDELIPAIPYTPNDNPDHPQSMWFIDVPQEGTTLVLKPVDMNNE